MWAALALLVLATLPAASADGVAEALAAAVAAADGDGRRVLWGGFKLREQDSYALELFFAAFLLAIATVNHAYNHFLEELADDLATADAAPPLGKTSVVVRQ
jgi:hypothetical protein